MTPTLRLRGQERVIDTTLVMGVVNASPESFSDGGRFHTIHAQRDHAASLIEAGADIVDIGGQSAVTNQPELEAEHELERVLPLVEWVRATYPGTLISIDTYKPLVASATLAAGADIVNDVSGLRNPELAGLCADSGAALVIMHTAAPPKVRRQDPSLYADVSLEVRDFLAERMAVAKDAGLPPTSIIVDPGPDFTKTPKQTIDLLRSLAPIRALERPLLLALSRKDFLGAITGRTPAQRDAATMAAIAYFAATPGNIVRVHDVAAAVDVIAVVETMEGRRDLAADYLLSDDLRYERTGD